MESCRYCGDTFADEEQYLEHLSATHEDELGAIDRRRVEDHRSGGAELAVSLGPLEPILTVLPRRLDLAIIGVVLFILIMLLWSVDFGGGTGNVHAHGSLIVTVNGEQLDLDQAKYHRPNRFHFHPGDGEVWHMHPERLTFEAAMAELGMPVSQSAIVINGTTYDGSAPGTSVTMRINDESAQLGHALQDGDEIEIHVDAEQ